MQQKPIVQKDKRIQIIWAHPRVDSLTARVVNGIKEQASALGIAVSELDLYRENFNPLMMPVDEPNFNAPQSKTYSNEVLEMAAALDGHDAAIIVYPVWWYSLPAILKGYIERVWNYGLLYGTGKRLPFNHLRWIALVGGGSRRYEDEKWDENMNYILNDGIAKYCGVDDSSVSYLYNTLAYEEHTEDLLAHHEALINEAKWVVKDLHNKWQD